MVRSVQITSVASGYVNAVRYGSAQTVRQLVKAAYQVLVARVGYGLGPRNFSLFQLGDQPRSDWKNYVVEFSEFKRALASLTPRSVHAIADDKVLFQQFCIAHALPTIPIVCVVTGLNGPEYPGLRVVRGIDTWLTALSGARSLFVKPVDGVFGEGAFTIEYMDGNYWFGGRSGSLDNAFRYVADRLPEGGGYLVQPRVSGHPGLASITARGLSTIRAVTCMSDGVPRLLYALMKITVGHSVTDNFHQGASGNLIAPVELDSGRLGKAIGSSRADWPVMTEFAHHPDTGSRIEGFVVPDWKVAVDLVLRAHKALPELKTTGWDVGITTDGPVLVETNPRYSFDILQVAYRRGLKEEIGRELGLSEL